MILGHKKDNQVTEFRVRDLKTRFSPGGIWGTRSITVTLVKLR